MNEKVNDHLLRSFIDNRTISDGKVKHIRTYKELQDRVVDHESGNKMFVKQFRRGRIDKIWK